MEISHLHRAETVTHGAPSCPSSRPQLAPCPLCPRLGKRKFQSEKGREVQDESPSRGREALHGASGQNDSYPSCPSLPRLSLQNREPVIPPRDNVTPRHAARDVSVTGSRGCLSRAKGSCTGSGVHFCRTPAVWCPVGTRFTEAVTLGVTETTGPCVIHLGPIGSVTCHGKQNCKTRKKKRTV